MCIPAGCFTVERTVPVGDVQSLSPQQLSQSTVVGLRLHFLEAVEHMKQLELLCEDHSAQAKPNDATKVFWKTILDACKKGCSLEAAGAAPSKSMPSKSA